jgi:hypothetical protein
LRLYSSFDNFIFYQAVPNELVDFDQSPCFLNLGLDPQKDPEDYEVAKNQYDEMRFSYSITE